MSSTIRNIEGHLVTLTGEVVNSMDCKEVVGGIGWDHSLYSPEMNGLIQRKVAFCWDSIAKELIENETNL